MQKKRPHSRRRGRRIISEKEDKIYFTGVVVETLPGTTFKVKVERSSKDSENPLPPIFIVCNLKAQLIRKVKVIRGDSVKSEVNPDDMYFNQETGILKGTIIQRF